MKAAAVARRWWAVFRRRKRGGPSAPAAGPPPGSAPALTAMASQVASYVLAALAATMLACAVAGFAVTVREDHRLAAVRHAALKRAIDELHSAFGGSDLDFDEARLPLITRLAALPDLHFDRDEANTSGREVQSVHDARGRISGWLSWAPDRALIRA